MKKRLLATLLVLAMLLSVMPVGIVTAEEAAEAAQCAHITEGWTAWGEGEGETSTLPTSGKIYLTKDVSLTASLQPNQATHDISICLNGHTITAATDGYRLFRVSNGAKLHICNCGQTGGLSDVNSGTFGGAAAYIAGATVELVNVDVKNNSNSVTANGGGAFWLQSNGKLYVTGGTISGNSTTLNGGALFAGGSGIDVRFTDTLITGNSNAGGGGSAIYGESGAAITLIDTTVTGNTNTASSGSGAVYMAGDSSPLTLSGKVIIDDNYMLSGTERNVYFNKVYGGKYQNVLFVNGLAEGSRITVASNTLRAQNELVQVSTAQGAEQPTWDPAWIKYENNGQQVHYNQTAFTFGHSHAADSGWTGWDGTGTVPTSGKVYLTKNVNLAERIVLTDTALTLCLNGYTLNYSGTSTSVGQLFKMDQTAQLTICDCTAYTHNDVYHAGKLTGGKTGAVIFVGSSTETAKLTLQDGIITGNSNANSGGGIIVQGAGAFHMEGGEICDNHSTNGDSGAVYTNSTNANGAFVMTGGKIYGNTAGKAGGGVYANKSIIQITGGEICDNEAATTGAGIYAQSATVTIEDCTLSGNTATGAGGALYVSSGSCTITDSIFTDNSGTNGGTIYSALSDCTISGTTITDNTATGNGNLFGGGTNFNISDTTISNNDHTGAGASAIYCERNDTTQSTVQLTDCTITGNSSTGGGNGAVYIPGTTHPLTVSGKTMIVDNTIKNGAAGNVYFAGTYAQGGHAQLYVNGLEEGSRIGITTAGTARTDANTVVKVSTAEGAAQTTWDVAWITYQNNGKNVFYDGETFSFDHIHTDGVEYTQTTTLPTTSGTYVLINDVTISDQWVIGQKNITLCLNGHDITLQDGGSTRLIGLKESAQLTICDCTGHTTEETVEGELVQTYHAGKLSGGNETGTGGGAVFVRRGTTFTLYDGIICGNVSHTACGAVQLQAPDENAAPGVPGGTFNMYGGEISGNACKNMGTGSASGGAVYVGGTFKMYGGTIKGNTSTKNGGAVYIIDAGAMTVTGGTFRNNASDQAGGAIYNQGSLTINKAQDSTVLFSGNRSSGGKSSGAIRHEGVAMSVTGAEFVNNTASTNAGAIYADRTGSLIDCTFTGNSAPNHGGALYCSADFTISGCSFTDNHSTVNGGGALAVFGGAEVTVSGSTFTGNTCASSGGALYANKSTLILQDNCVVSGNNANNNGGAFYGDTADFTVTNSEITGNTVTRADADNGSAFSLSNGGTINIQDGANIHDNGIIIAAIATSGGTINISGGTITEPNCTDSAVAIYGGNMTMTGGTLTGCTGSKGVVYFSGTTFDMSGGKITNNPTRGVMINKGTMNLSGTGEISYNNWDVAGIDGAGIRVNNDAHLEMTGGKICNNHCTNRKYSTSGGGINIRGTANLLGGEICHNSAHNAGGVLVRTNLTTIGGTCHIHDNKAYNQGGGVNVFIGNLNLENGAVIENNQALQGAGLYMSTTAGTVNINGGTITGNTVANGYGYDNEGNLTDTLVPAQGAAVLAIGGVVNLNGGVITNTNTGTVYGSALYIGNAAYVTLTGTKLENIPDDDNAETALENTVYLSTGAIPMKVTPDYVQTHTANSWEQIRTSMNGYGRFAQGTVADQDGTYTSYTNCFGIKADCDRNQMLRPVEDPTYLYMTPSTDKVFTLTYIKDGEKVPQKLNHFEDIYDAYKAALDLADANTTPYIDLNASYQGIPVGLTNDLYLHLNGYSLHSMISAADQYQVTIYGTDTATDDYGKEDGFGNLRIAMIVDGNGEKSTGGITVKNAWQSTTKTGSAKNKRYMAAITNTSENYRDTEDISDLTEDQTGFKETAIDGKKTYAEGPYYWFNFHRFYAGVTHSNLNGRMRGLGYKAVFAGDSVVKEHLVNNGIAAVTDDGSETAEFGFYLWLEDSQGNMLSSQKVAYGMSADAFVAEDTSANTYVWRINDILLDEEDEKDVAVATRNGYATVDEWNQYYKDVVVCAQPFMCLDLPTIPDDNGGNDVVDQYEVVTTSTYRFTMQQLLELVDANVETYYPTTIDWDGLVGFCEKFETYFAGWSISNIISYVPAAVSQS